MSNFTREIAELEQLINSAVSSTSADGVSASFDLDAARRRLAELKRLADPTDKKARRIISRVNLGCAW
ncbi:MAG: hypothetical protein AB7I57_18360 [Pirellulales bacterium]